MPCQDLVMYWPTLKATLLRVPLFEVLTFDLSVEVVDDDDNDGWWDDVGWCKKSGNIMLLLHLSKFINSD